MRIGITERGDAGIDLSWKSKLNTVNGAVLITKNITDDFINTVISTNKPLIIHCTCTGWGGSPIEPNVPDFKTQLSQLKKLIRSDFPAERCVLRIDPIFPNTAGISRARNVINTFIAMNLKIARIRISIVDEYRHIKERYKQHKWQPIYADRFGPDNNQIGHVASLFAEYPQFTFETCAEDKLSVMATNIVSLGCISKTDLEIMGLSMPDNTYENPQNRKGCHCLNCKTELLSNKHPCKNGCVYCYWR